MTKKSLFERIAPAILILTALATPLIFYGAYRAIRSNTNKVVDWLPASFSETADLAWYRDRFAGDQFVIVSWEGCEIGGDPADPNSKSDDPRIEELARILVPEQEDLQPIISEAEGTASAVHEARVLNGQKRYFKNVVTARRLLDQLTNEPLNVPYDVATERLRGSLIGDDGRTSCLVVSLTDEALLDFRKAIGRGNEKWRLLHRPQGALFDALDQVGISHDEVRMGGPPVDNVAIDEEGEKTLIRLLGLSSLLGLFLAWRALKSVKLTIMVFICGALSAAASLGAVWAHGDTTDAVVLAMPSLVYVLAVSGAVHLLNYYRDAIDRYGLRAAPLKALIHAWKPALFCSLTTGIGLFTLVTSDLTPIRKFGYYSSLGMFLMLGALFVFLPAALQVWPVPNRRRKADELKKEEDAHPAPTRIERFWEVVGDWIMKRHGLVATGCLLLIALACVGITRVRTSIDLMGLFDKDARVISDYRWLEAEVGRLVPLEIVLAFDEDVVRKNDESPGDADRLNLLERAEIVDGIQRAVEKRFGAGGEDVIGPSLSAATFVPPLPPNRGGFQATIRRSVTNTKLESSYDAIKQTGYLRSDPETGAELWRISVRIGAFQDVDFGAFSDAVRETVDPMIAKTNAAQAAVVAKSGDGVTNVALPADETYVKATYTGVVPIVYKAQRALLTSLIESTGWSILTISPLLMIISRGIWAGLVAMIPNILPIAFVFGGMGWLDIAVDIGAMMSASIALGVAVDDTVHYLAWFREELDRTGDRVTGIRYAYRKCATPTLQAAIINGLGLSIFAFSTFTPTKQFGYLMLTILAAGVVAELILLPALLAGPLGRAFKPRKSGKPSLGPDESANSSSGGSNMEGDPLADAAWGTAGGSDSLESVDPNASDDARAGAQEGDFRQDKADEQARTPHGKGRRSGAPRRDPRASSSIRPA